jgi:hypothetical protein
MATRQERSRCFRSRGNAADWPAAWDDDVRWAAAEGVSETIVAAVLLLHERSVDETAVINSSCCFRYKIFQLQTFILLGLGGYLMAKNSKRCAWTPAQVRALKTLAKKKTHGARLMNWSLKVRCSVFHFRSPATHLCRAYSFSWPLPPSASAPASAPAASKATSQKPNHKQKQDGADGSVDDRGDNTGTEVDADLRQQPVANECADNAYYEIADESESGAPYDLSGQPTSNKTDKQYDQKTFIWQMHGGASKPG